MKAISSKEQPDDLMILRPPNYEIWMTEKQGRILFIQNLLGNYDKYIEYWLSTNVAVLRAFISSTLVLLVCVEQENLRSARVPPLLHMQ